MSRFAKSRTRDLIARAAFLLLPLAFIFLAEGVLAVLGIATPRRFFENGAGGRIFSSPNSPWGSAEERFNGASFQVPKPKDVLRIFCVGASTVRGFPFDPHLSFANWLGVRLEALLPHLTVEVFALAENAKNAHDVSQLVAEVVSYQPDALLVYCGHNELHVQNLPRLSENWAQQVVRRLRHFRLGRCIFSEPTRANVGPATATMESYGPLVPRPLMTAEIRERALRLYEKSLRSIVSSARKHQVPVFLSRTVANLLDYPPAGSILDQSSPSGKKALALEQQAREVLWKDLQSSPTADGFEGDATELLHTGLLESTPPSRFSSQAAHVAQALLQQAIDVSPQTSRLHFLQGRLLLALGQTTEALASLQRALRLDAYPMRASREFNDLVVKVAEETEAILVDPEADFLQCSPSGILGRETILDYVHPNLVGQRILAENFVLALIDAGVVGKVAKGSLQVMPLTDYENGVGLSQKKTILAGQLAELGWVCVEAFAVHGAQIRPSCRLAFEVAVELDPRCLEGQVGTALIRCLDERNTTELKALLPKSSKLLRRLGRLGTQHDEWRDLLHPVLKAAKGDH